MPYSGLQQQPKTLHLHCVSIALSLFCGLVNSLLYYFKVVNYLEHSLSSPNNLGDENVDNQPGSRLERDEHLRPVARITPMSRQQFDTVVPAPRTKATGKN